MRIQTEAFLLGTTDIHSNKSGKDFVKVNMILEGEFVGFFTRKTDGDRIKTAKPFQELKRNNNNPTRCVATLDLKFGVKGTFVDLVSVDEYPTK